MTKPEPLPTPSTDHDLTNIESDEWLTAWDQYVCSILQGALAFHGTSSSAAKVADYVTDIADALMAERQERAQGHVDQQIVERAKAKEEAKKATK